MIYATPAAPLTTEDSLIWLDRLAKVALPIDRTMLGLDRQENEALLRQAKIQNADPAGLDHRGMVRDTVRWVTGS